MRSVDTDFGLTRIHDLFNAPDELAELLDKHGVPRTHFDLPNIVGMAGAAWLMGYVPPDTHEPVTVLVVPHRYNIDEFGIAYYYFDGMSWEDATGPDAETRWGDLYDQCEEVDRELSRFALKHDE